MFFKRIIISLFLIFSFMFMFIFFIRLANGQKGFLGLSDLMDYFSSVDFKKPVDDFIYIVNKTKDFYKGIFTYLSTGNMFLDFILPVTGIMRIIEIVSIIGSVIYGLIVLIIGYIEIFASFISYIISFKGYISSSF